MITASSYKTAHPKSLMLATESSVPAIVIVTSWKLGFFPDISSAVIVTGMDRPLCAWILVLLCFCSMTLALMRRRKRERRPADPGNRRFGSRGLAAGSTMGE